jgi:NAD(P)H-hydrate epimerase
MDITIPWSHIPALTAEQMGEVDQVMVSDLRIELVQMMENAGRSLAELAMGLFTPASVTVLAGNGGNGGGGLVAARHLANRGVQVGVVVARQDLAGVADHQLDILRRMEIALRDEPGAGDLVLDAIIGYGLRGDPRGRAADLIEWANGVEAPVLALDTPSGLDVTTGQARSPCIRADATMTLALPKIGLRRAPEVGRLFLADISVPPRVYERFEMKATGIFHGSQIVEIDRD